MDVVRDLLDKQVIDRNGREMGRVDGIELELGPTEPPRLAHILIGPSVLADRVQPVIGRLVAALEVALGVAAGRPVRIAVKDIARIHRNITVDCSSSETAADAVEKRARDLVARLPGA